MAEVKARDMMELYLEAPVLVIVHLSLALVPTSAAITRHSCAGSGKPKLLVRDLMTL